MRWTGRHKLNPRTNYGTLLLFSLLFLLLFIYSFFYRVVIHSDIISSFQSAFTWGVMMVMRNNGGEKFVRKVSCSMQMVKNDQVIRVVLNSRLNSSYYDAW